MTVSATLSWALYGGDGQSTGFGVPFRFMDASHLEVRLRTADGTESLRALGLDYSVSGVDLPAGGVVTFVVPPPAGAVVGIRLRPPATQAVDLRAGAAIDAETVERALDLLTMQDLAALEAVQRAPLIPFTAGLRNPIFEAPVAGKALVGRLDGQGWTHGDLPGAGASSGAVVVGGLAITKAGQDFLPAANRLDVGAGLQASLEPGNGAELATVPLEVTVETGTGPQLVVARTERLHFAGGYWTVTPGEQGQLVLYPPGLSITRGEQPSLAGLFKLDIGAGLVADYHADEQRLYLSATPTSLVVSDDGGAAAPVASLDFGAGLAVASDGQGHVTVTGQAGAGGGLAEPIISLQWARQAALPAGLADGDLVYADGTAFLPISPNWWGRGFYRKRGDGSFQKLLDSKDAAKLPLRWVTTQTASVGAADVGSSVQVQGAAGTTITVNALPTGSTALEGCGDADMTRNICAYVLEVEQRGAGAVTLTAGAGVSLSGTTTTAGDKQRLTLRYLAPGVVECERNA